MMNTTFLDRAEIQNQAYVETMQTLEDSEIKIKTAQERVAEITPIMRILRATCDSSRFGSSQLRTGLEEKFQTALNAVMFEHFPDLNPVQLDVMGINGRISIQNTLLLVYRQMRADYQASNDDMQTQQRIVNNLREHLENLSPDPEIFIKNQIDAQLMKIEGVIPGSVCISHQQSGLPQIQATTLHWRMEPGLSAVNGLEGDRHPQWFHVDKIYVPHGGCEVRIDLQTKNCKILPTDPDEALYLWQNTRNVHPHILEQHNPCFGDFSGPYAEAVAEQRWGDVASLIRLFLTNIDAADSAGKHWTQFFRNKFADRLVTDRFGQPTSSRGYKHYFQNEDGSWYTKLSRRPVEFEEITPIDLENLEKQRDELNMSPRFVTSDTIPTFATTF